MPSTFIRQTGKLIEVNRRGSGARTSRDYDNIPSPMVDKYCNFLPSRARERNEGKTAGAGFRLDQVILKVHTYHTYIPSLVPTPFDGKTENPSPFFQKRSQHKTNIYWCRRIH